MPGLSVEFEVPGTICVTGSVAVGSERDERDTTGHNPVIEGYLA